MTGEQWRAAVARWGDPVFSLALLLTNERAAAESITIAAFARTLASPLGSDLDHALYSALWKAQPRRRLPRLQLRHRILPPAVARIDKTDRFLLGLWLLRNVDGSHIANITGLSQQQIIERFAAVITRRGNLEPRTSSTEHLTLPGWLELQLSIAEPIHGPPADHPRVCRECQETQLTWQAARDALQTLLRDGLRQQHLPYSSVDAIEDALQATHTPDVEYWWWQRKVWLPALIVGVGLLFAALVMPRGDSANTTQSPSTNDPRALVEATIQGWTAEPIVPLHRQVWARDPRLHNGEPVVTDVWLDSTGSTRHRVEVRRGGKLVEWQVADGRSRFDYAAEAADSSCRWNTGWSGHYGKLNGAPARFSIQPGIQREVRDARLQHGAYGVGYVTLQRALAAQDLRSFGMRTDNGRKLVVLRYTDQQVQPPRQLVLHLDMEAKQLDAVQEVQVVDNQAKTLDVWRVERNQELETAVSLEIPDGPPSVARDTLIDPACPALNEAYIASPRTLLEGLPLWYAPRTLPNGINRLMLLRQATSVGQRAQQGFNEDDPTLLLTGTGRWLSVSYATTQPSYIPSSNNGVRFGNWLLTIDPANSNGLWHARLTRADDLESNYGRPLELWARGWTEDELLAVIGTIGQMDTVTWLAMQRHFVDPQPLPADVQATIEQALTALHPQPNQAVVVTSTTSVRVDSNQRELADPYHASPSEIFPPTVTRQQILSYQDGHIEHYHDRRTLPDNTIFELRQDDGNRFHWYSSLTATTYVGKVELLRAFVRPEQAPVEILTTLLTGQGLITIQQSDDTILLTQPVDPSLINNDNRTGPWTPQNPSTQGLGLGTFIRRVWIDSETNRPRAAAISHQRQDGFETLISETTFGEWRAQDTPPATMFTLPRLPDDVFTLDVTDGPSKVVEKIEPPQRMLAWRDRMVAGEFKRTLGPWSANSITEQHLRGSWLRPSGLAASVTLSYQIEPTTELHFTQVPRNVLRHVLRQQSRDFDAAETTAWKTSRAINVTIAGKQREAWLLQGDLEAALVVEVDELALHFNGPVEYLTGPLLELLPQLEWSSAPPP